MRDPASAAASSASAPQTDPAQALRTFCRAIGEPPPERPTLPSPELLQMRRTLLREEWAEVEEELDLLAHRLEQRQAGSALTGPDATDPAADPAIDAAAELHRLAHELTDLLYVTYGTLVQLGIDPAATFAAVHDANMRKVGGPRRADGKLLKPQGWQPADMHAVLREQQEPES